MKTSSSNQLQSLNKGLRIDDQSFVKRLKETSMTSSWNVVAAKINELKSMNGIIRFNQI